MHQGHNIPWNIITSNYKYTEEDKRYTPPFTGLALKSPADPKTKQELKHFVKKFAQTIRTFSDTERAKYPKIVKPRTTGLLFSNEIRNKHPEYLNEKNQQIDYWIQRAQKTSINYNTCDGDLADVVKVLLHENEMETLLMLAQHPDIPIADLRFLSWGHHFGFSRVKESALNAYIFFNAADATGTLERGQYACMARYGSLLREISISMDYPAQQIPHVEFLRACGALGSDGHLINISYREMGTGWAKNVHVHANYGLLQQYLKQLFALIYRYDVFVREYGLQEDWEAEIDYYLPPGLAY